MAGVQDFRDAFAGLRIEGRATVAEDELIVCRIEISGTHVRDFAGYPATHRPVAFPGMDMHRIVGDRIAETWHFEHLHGLAGAVIEKSIRHRRPRFWVPDLLLDAARTQPLSEQTFPRERAAWLRDLCSAGPAVAE